MTAWRAARRGPGTVTRVHDLREIVNAILYVCRTGIAWEYLPHDFPPYKTVYDYYAKWEADGTTETLHDLLRQQVRVVRGRARTPTAAIIDSQSVKTSCNVAETSQGIDAGKKIKGRKRHIATDALGCCWSRSSPRHPCRTPRADTRYSTSSPIGIRASPRCGWTAATTTPSSATAPGTTCTSRSSNDLPARDSTCCPAGWVVERTLGWLMQHRRLVRDYETLPQPSRVMIHWASANTMSLFPGRRIHPHLAHESTQSGHRHLNQDQMPSESP